MKRFREIWGRELAQFDNTGLAFGAGSPIIGRRQTNSMVFESWSFGALASIQTKAHIPYDIS